MYDQVVTFHIQAASHHPPDLSANLRIIVRVFKELFGMILLAPPGLVLIFRRNRDVGVWLSVWLVISALFLIRHSPLFPRHAVLLMPPLALAAAGNVLWFPIIGSFRDKIVLSVLLLPFIVMPGYSLWQDQRRLSGSLGLPESDRQVIHFIEENTQQSDYVVSDQQMQVFRSGRLIPPQLCDTSFVRIQSGYLTDEQAIEASSSARIIIFATGRLAKLDRFEQWVTNNYSLVSTFEVFRLKVFIKREPHQSDPPQIR